jgi:hypothetical protein
MSEACEYLILSFERKTTEFRREIFSYAMMLQATPNVLFMAS